MDTFDMVCSRCGCARPFDVVGTCACGGTLLVRYDAERIGHAFKRKDLKIRPWTMWRYRELLPVRNPDAIVSLGEGGTPLLRLRELEREMTLGGLYSKREELNPTGSFKARGFSSALSLLHERGIRKVAVNSNGNAAAALAAYAARCGMEAYVFVPQDCPGMIVEECLLYGASTYLVDGFIQDAGAIVSAGEKEQGWFHVGTLKEPGRAEGKKTMGLEVAEQLGWTLPDVIVYPTGGGSGIIGLWRAFELLRELGWVKGELPRFVSVQEEGCDPVVRGMQGENAHLKEEEVTSNPTGLRVPSPPDLQIILSVLRRTNGTAVAVSAEQIRSAIERLGRYGLTASPEGAATWAGMLELRERQWIRPGETVVLFNTSHAAKYWNWTVSKRLPVVRSYDDFARVIGGRK